MIHNTDYTSFLKETATLFNYLKELQKISSHTAIAINLTEKFKNKQINLTYLDLLSKLGCFKNEQLPLIQWNTKIKIDDFFIKQVFDYKNYLQKNKTFKLTLLKLLNIFNHLEKIIFVYKVDLKFIKELFDKWQLDNITKLSIVYYMTKSKYLIAADKNTYRLNNKNVRNEDLKELIFQNILLDSDNILLKNKDTILKLIKFELGLLKLDKLTLFEKKLLKDFIAIRAYVTSTMHDQPTIDRYIKNTFQNYRQNNNIFKFLHENFLESSSTYIIKKDFLQINSYDWNSRKYSKIYKKTDLPDSKMIQQIVRKKLKFIKPI